MHALILGSDSIPVDFQLEVLSMRSKTQQATRSAVVAALCAGPLATLLPTASAQSFRADQVPYALQRHWGSGSLRSTYQRGSLLTNAAAKSLEIHWTASAIVNEPPDYSLTYDPANNALGPYRAQSSTQELSTRYFPTASCALTTSSLLIAGVAPTSEWVLERWELVWPDPMPAPVTDPQTGLVSVPVALPNRARVQTLRTQPLDPTQGVIKFVVPIERIGAEPGSCLLGFHDSGELWVFDFASGSLQLLASPTDPTALLGAAPALGETYHVMVEFGSHRTEGNVYHPVSGFDVQQAPSALDPMEVLLLDTDRNGVIDEMRLLPFEEFAAQGWNDASNYGPPVQGH